MRFSILLLLLAASCKTTGKESVTGDDSGETTCWVDDGRGGTCYDCPPPTAPESDSLKFLNQCTDAAYAAFDNSARIPASTWVPGTPLPTL